MKQVMQRHEQGSDCLYVAATAKHKVHSCSVANACRYEAGAVPMMKAGSCLARSELNSTSTGGPTAKLTIHLLGEGLGSRLTCTTAPSKLI